LNHVPLSYTNGKTREDNMSELVIKTARENEDLPKKGYPTPPYKSKNLKLGDCGPITKNFRESLNILFQGWNSKQVQKKE